MDSSKLIYDLSVIIPCHNLEEYIQPMLNSLNSQNLKDYEVELIFVCDACEDKTHEIIENFSIFLKEKYRNIIILDVDEHSQGISRNKGLEIEQGKFIIFLDGDDWLIDNSAFVMCIEALKNNPESILVRYEWKHSKFFNRNKYSQDVQMYMVWQYCFRAETIGDIRFKNMKPHEDAHFITDIFNQYTGQEVSYTYIQTPLYYYNFGRLGSVMQQLFATGKIE